MNDKEIRINEALNCFENLGLKYTVESISFLININKSVPELSKYSEGNCLYLVTAGLKEKTLEEGKKALTLLMAKGLDLPTIHALCKERAMDQGFSLGEMGMEILAKKSEEPQKQMIMAAPFLQELEAMLQMLEMEDITEVQKKP